MESMQAMILDKLELNLTLGGMLQMRQQSRYGNTGALYVQSGLHTLLEVDYDFQDNQCRIGAIGVQPGDLPDWVTIPGDAYGANFSGGRKGLMFHVTYGDGETISRMLRALAHVVHARHGALVAERAAEEAAQFAPDPTEGG